MKKIIALILLICMIVPTAFAYNVIERSDIIHKLDLDNNDVGGNWNRGNGVVVDYNGSKQLELTNTGNNITVSKNLASSAALTGSFNVEYDVTPETESVQFVVQTKEFVAAGGAQGGSTWGIRLARLGLDGGIYTYASGNDSGGNLAGYYIAGEKLHFKFEMNYLLHTYDAYLTGMYKKTKDGDAVYADNMYIGTYNVNTSILGLGTVYFYYYNVSTGKLWLDNHTISSADIKYGLDGDKNYISVGAEEIKLYINQMIKKTNFVIKKNGIELTKGTDYTVECEYEYLPQETLGNPTVKLTTPTVEGDVFEIDFSKVEDGYGKTLKGDDLKFVCVSEEEAAAFENAASAFEDTFVAANSGIDLTAVTDDITLPADDGNGFSITWNKTSDENVIALDGTVTRPPYSETEDTSKEITLEATISSDKMSKTVLVTMTVLMKDPDDSYYSLKNAYEALQEILPAEGTRLYEPNVFPATVEAPDYTGIVADVTYEITAPDGVFAIENGESVPNGILVTELKDDMSEYDTPITVKATVAKTGELPFTVTRNYSVAYRTLLTNAASGNEATVLLDGSPDTAWEPQGNEAETVIALDKTCIIGDARLVGDFDSVEYYVALGNGSYTKVEKFPVEADKLKIVVKKAGGGIKVSALETVLNDEQLSEFDVIDIKIENDLSLITADYITLPILTRNGLEIVWETSDASVIDKYGKVYRGDYNESVTLTAKAKDSDGNIIDKYFKQFTATVKAKEKTSSGGGGGGGSSSKNTGITIGGNIKAPEKTELISAEKPESVTIFADIQNSWAKEAIVYLMANKVVNGKTEDAFMPDETVTREQFVKMSVIAFALSEGTEEIPEFTDVAEDAWYKEYIDIAASCGIVMGADGKFGTGENITREDIAVILNRMIDYKEVTLKNETEKVFNDADMISDYALESVNALASAEIIGGYADGGFKPKANATRAEAAQMIYKIMTNYPDVTKAD